MMTYESPITLMTEEIANDFTDKTEGLIMESVQHVGVSVDKDELVRALNYDREQYEKGYRDGLSDAVKRGKWEYIGGYGYKYRCSNCIMCAEHKTPYCPHCGARMEE